MSTEDIKEMVHRVAKRPQRPQGRVPADCSGKLTPSLEEGPFYKPGSPERTSIVEPGTIGRRLIIEGYVFDKNCRPIANAWLDFWQADGRGMYDNAAYNLRGHQYTDVKGLYRLETVRPIGYGPRTAHIHAKVRAKRESPVLTVQLFFPGIKKNQEDPIFDSSLVMNITHVGDIEKAAYNFVLDAE